MYIETSSVNLYSPKTTLFGGDPKLNERERKIWTIGLGTAVVAVLLMTALVSALPASDLSALSLGGAKTGADSAVASADGSGPQFPTPIHHVFLILMENEQTSVIYNQQPYETTLANTYGWGGDANNPDSIGYYAVCHPSAPNYLALTSGQALQCGSDGFATYSVNNLGNLLQTAGKSWIAYEESASQPCQQTDSLSGLYVVRHNPFPYYSDLGGTTPGSVCMTHVVPIANLTTDYPYARTPPAFTYIAPNILNDGHSSSAATGDHWLSTFIPNLIAQPWFASTAVFIVYDEAYTAHGDENFSGYDGLVGGPVYMVAASPYTQGIGALAQNNSHYDLLSTMEWLLGLSATGKGLDGTPQFPVMTSLFQARVFGPGVNLRYTHLPAADLSGLDLQNDNLAYADLAAANLQGADLQGAHLQHADLAGANLRGADLQGAYLAGADFLVADLQGANLQFADAPGASFELASLKNANLAHADLQGSDLQGAEPKDANLEYADMTGAVLTGFGPSPGRATDFNGADLYMAILTHAVCGTPNYITAIGANVGAIGVPSSCRPPL